MTERPTDAEIETADASHGIQVEHELRIEIERLRAALTWYGEEVEAIAAKLNGKKVIDNPASIEASLVVLSLDGGRRARAALIWETQQRHKHCIKTEHALQAEIERLRAALGGAYDDAKEGAINPMLYEDGDGPLDLQRKIGQAIEFRKRTALEQKADDK